MSARPRMRWLIFGGVVFLSAALVVGAFNPAPHTGGDNAGYLSLAFGLLKHGTYTDLFDPAGLPHTKYPPVFPGILALLMLLGARTWGVFKATAAVATVATVAFTYLWAERRLGAWGAAAVALLVTMSSAVLYYSHWILSDPVFLAFTMAGLWALDRADEEGASTGWLVGGLAAAGLAYFTRSAGLPLVVAVLGWLVLRKRWRALAGASVAIGVPALLWWLRGRSAGVAQYGTEFWLIDPYQPTLGTIGIGGLVPRAIGNLSAYVTRHGPGGIVGARGAWVAAIGVALTAAALYGWYRSVRRRPGPAELFLPLYAGLILLWPEVWAGDRFVLPLYPLFFLFGALALRQWGERVGKKSATVAYGTALAVLLLPAASSWMGAAREASGCATVMRTGGSFACYGPNVSEFAAAAGWIGEALPEGSSVMTRKPRLFYLLSGVPSRTFPFDDDPAVQLATADRLGSRYVLLDQWDGLAMRYVGRAVSRYPGAFCSVRSFPGQGGAGPQLLGLEPLAERDATPPPVASEEIRISFCSPAYVRQDAPEGDYSSSISRRIPLLDGLDP